MSADDKITPSAVGEGHNYSAQQGVEINPDPVLDLSNEHHHAHVHHGATAVPPEKDDLMFATSTDKYTGTSGSPDYKVHPMSSRDDGESGVVGDIRNEDEKASSTKWSPKRLYKQYKIAFHLAIWLVWTA